MAEQKEFIKERIQSSFESYVDYLKSLDYDTIVIIAYDTKTEVCNTMITGKRNALLTVAEDLKTNIIKSKGNGKGH